MEQVAYILIVIAMILLIIVQIHDIIRTHRFYNQMEKEYKDYIESLKGGENNDIKR